MAAHRPERMQAPRGGPATQWLALAGWMAAIALCTNALPLPGPASPRLDLLEPLLWAGAGALALHAWRQGSPEPTLKAQRPLLLAAALAAALQIALWAVAGLVDGFGAPGRLRLNGPAILSAWPVAFRVMGVELARWQLVSAPPCKRARLGFVVGWLLPWLAGANLKALAGAGSPAVLTYPLHYQLLPTATLGLLATYIVSVGGPLASLAYSGGLAAFLLLSPGLPTLTWPSSLLLAFGGPLVGWLVVSDRAEQEREHQTLERKVARRTVELSQANELLRAERERLQALSRRLVDAQEAERRYIAHEIHDEAGQALASLLLGLGLLEREVAPAPARLRVGELKAVAAAIYDSLHRLATDLRPVSLDRLGLAPALRQHAGQVAARSGLEVQFEAVGLEKVRLRPQAETALFRIVQEALTNVVRHAQATRADVLLERRDGRVIAMVEDDGVGFEHPRAASGQRLGLQGMRERAEMLGGTLTIETAPGAGTTVLVEVPYADPDR